MFTRRTVTIFVVLGTISIFILGAFLAYDFKFGRETDLFERPAISRERAQDIAKIFLKSQGFDSNNYPTRYTRYSSYNKEVLYLLRQYGYKEAKQLIKKEKIPYTFWWVTWSASRYESVSACVDSQDGRIISYFFSHYPNPQETVNNLKEAEARNLAQRFLVAQGIDVAGLELVNSSKNTRNIQEEYYYKWLNKQVKLAQARYIINVSIAADKVASYYLGLELPQNYMYEYKNSQFVSNFWMGLAFGISFLLGIILVILAIIKRSSLDWGLGRLWAKMLGLVFLLYFLNQQSSYVFYIDLIFKIISTLFYALIMFVLIPVTGFYFKEGFNKEIFIDKQDKNNLIASVIICYAFTFISLVLVFGVYSLFKHLKIFWDVGTDNVVSAIFTSKIIYLSPFFIGIMPAFMEEFFRGFTMGFCKKILKNTILSVLIAAFLWGFLHTAVDGSSYPGYIPGLEKFINGIIVCCILLYFGIEFAILWHFLNNFLATSIFLFYLGPQLASYATFLCLLILAPFFVAIYLYFKKPPLAVQS
jgi:hypothetical protein